MFFFILIFFKNNFKNNLIFELYIINKFYSYLILNCIKYAIKLFK